MPNPYNRLSNGFEQRDAGTFDQINAANFRWPRLRSKSLLSSGIPFHLITQHPFCLFLRCFQYLFPLPFPPPFVPNHQPFFRRSPARSPLGYGPGCLFFSECLGCADALCLCSRRRRALRETHVFYRSPTARPRRRDPARARRHNQRKSGRNFLRFW